MMMNKYFTIFTTFGKKFFVLVFYILLKLIITGGPSMFRAPLLSIHDVPSLMHGYEDMNIFLIPSIESDVEGMKVNNNKTKKHNIQIISFSSSVSFLKMV